MRYLYKLKKLNICHSQIEDNFKCGLFSPSIKKWRLLNEKLTFKKFAARVMFYVITAGKSKVCYVIKDDKVVHTSYVVPSCYKFAFLSRNDYEIGPCYTHPEYRGQGIYPFVLRTICEQIGNQNTTFYMIVDENNLSSIKGIEKAGFKRCGVVMVNKLTKRYRRI